MKRKKLFIVLGIIVALVVGTATASYAAAISDPEGFLADRLAQIRERLDNAVEDGRITAAEADEIYADKEERIQERIADGSCDGVPDRDGEGNGFGCNGGGFGKGFGSGKGMGQSACRGTGIN